MKKILIVGQNSYIGNNFEKWMYWQEKNSLIKKISVRDNSWRQYDFSPYDVVVHVAGIAHIKENNKNKHLYYSVNRDLVYEVALKAKEEGVSQFVFLSSMSVYGKDKGRINKNSILCPNSAYGTSKKQAEELIYNLNSNKFLVNIIRPPMVYGKGCGGNYVKLRTFALNFPLFPYYLNKRSVIHIDNLCEIMRLVIKNEDQGLYCPQNKEYASTQEIVKSISKIHNSPLYLTKIFNPFIVLLRKLNINIINKVFGDLVYDKEISTYKENYRIREFEKSIELTEMERDDFE
ncbi:NAD-dependent epimerase/dehydratase family protein [Marinococcus halophilus]|uniref:NAD-dependent epimerase/dehydratase family protein n=1 Tax=Marinococcus halophilus TaxID=1371 RepID=UPI0009A607B3|nr:NAD-dependent epimerase/dehydratase family protein [Marinococcus halophilus]